MCIFLETNKLDVYMLLNSVLLLTNKRRICKIRVGSEPEMFDSLDHSLPPPIRMASNPPIMNQANKRGRLRTSFL